MKAITAFLSGLLLSAILLLPASIRAAELQPFVTYKVASPNTLISVAEKFASMAGASSNAEFRQFLNTVKNVKGFDLNGIIGVAAAVNDDGDISPLLLLPLTDFEKAEIPNHPQIFDSIRPFVVKKGEGKFDINTPMGTYAAVQQQNYLVIVPEDAADQIPADAKKLFADLEKYTIGIKLDLEKVEFETIEAKIFGPMLMAATLFDPTAGEQIETVVEVYRELYKEYALLTGGAVFNPQTADVEISTAIVVRKNSNMAKMFAGYKVQPTIFSGFRGTPENTVFALGESAAVGQSNFDDKAMMELGRKHWETIFSGMLEQIEMEDETGETSELAKKAVDSLNKIVETESTKGSGDYALSFNTDGTMLFAFDTASLDEIQKLAALIVEHGNKHIPDEAKTLITNNVNLNSATVEGFKVSNIKIPLLRVLEALEGPAPDVAQNVWNNVMPGVFWATKGGNKQAIAVAVGLDFAKTEQAFKSALEKTKTAVPVQKPVGNFFIGGLGKFLQQKIYPIAEKAVGAGPTPEDVALFRQVTDTLAAAGNDAVITLDSDVKADRIDGHVRISGKVIQVVISAGKLAYEAAPTRIEGPAIQDF